ncbi:hypothetical protein ALC53_04369 [Atta colombica]|uniref:Uncharacterized protein n=1 Tax=Atta colombica TaxID=520822 RepID=A0A151I518_9HYME|nr:hypothetical protein ALC53_04369 [Atta colombica]
MLAAFATESILIGFTGIATLTRYSKSTLTLSCYWITILPIGHSEQMGSGLLPRRMQGPLSGQGHAYDIIKSNYQSPPRKYQRAHYSCKEHKEQRDRHWEDRGGIRARTTRKTDRRSREDTGNVPPNRPTRRLRRDEPSLISHRPKILDLDEYKFHEFLWRSSLTELT